MNEDKNHYIKLYPKTAELKQEIVKLARKNGLTTSAYVLSLLKQEIEKQEK